MDTIMYGGFHGGSLFSLILVVVGGGVVVGVIVTVNMIIFVV